MTKTKFLVRHPLVSCTIAGAVMLGPASADSLMAQQIPGREISVEAGAGDVEVQSETLETTDRRDRQAAGSSTASSNRRAQAVVQWIIPEQRAMVDLASYASSETNSPEVKGYAERLVRDHENFVQKLKATLNDSMSSSRDAARSETESDITVDAPDVDVRVDAQSDLPSDDDVTDVNTLPQEQRRLRDAGGRLLNGNRLGDRGRLIDRDGDRRPLRDLGDRLGQRVERLADRADEVIGEVEQVVDPLTEGQGLGQALNLGAGSANGPWLKIHDRIVHQVQQETRKELQERSGYEFDAAFLGMATAAHMQEMATLEVLSNQVDGEMRQLLDQHMNTLKQHKQAADDLMDQLQGSVTEQARPRQ